MDPAIIKKLEDAAAAEVAKIWGPHTPEFVDYLSKQEVVNFNGILSPTSHLIKHFKVEGRFNLTNLLARGFYESRKLKVNKEDILLVSFPKCGTTWLQEIMFLILSDCDFDKVKDVIIDDRVPAIEWPECTFKVLQERPSPRILKTHIPYSLLPGGDVKKQCKIVYLTRNPKDVATSMFHFYKLIKPLQFAGDMNDMLNLFLADASIYSPFDKHVLEYWDHVKDGNVLFVKYEDLHKDCEREIERLAKYLGKNLTPEQISTIANCASFKEMSAKGTTNHSQWDGKNISDPNQKFMRKGKVGDWKNHFDVEMNRRFDEYIARNIGKSTLTYDYE